MDALDIDFGLSGDELPNSLDKNPDPVLAAYRKAAAVTKGGEGSGYTTEAGHRGIPGQQGGSLPADAGDVFARIDGDGRRFTTTELHGFSSKRKLNGLCNRTFYDNPEIDMEEKRAIGMYQADGYMAINEYLRTGEISEAASTRLENQINAEGEGDLLESGVQGALKDLTMQIESSIKDGAIDLVPTEEDPLIRGMLINDNDLEFIKNITTPGTEFEDKGFVSATLWDEVARKFMRPSSNKKSFRALIVSAVSGHLRGLVLDGSEAEILLPRGSRFRVLRADPPTEGDSFLSGSSASHSWTIYLEAL